MHNQEKSVLIVGNGYSIKDSNLGKKINQFDEIIRINDWKTKGYEKDAGTKTTIWVTYNPIKGHVNFIEGYKKLGYTIEEIKDIVKNINEIWYVSFKIENLLLDWKNSSYLKELGIYNKIKRHQSLQYSKKVQMKVPLPTTGLTLVYILSHMYDKIYLVGYDFTGVREGVLPLYHHYYGEKITKNLLDGNIHNSKSEFLYVENMISKDRIEYLTKDTKIKKGHYIGKYNKNLTTTCKNCNQLNLLYDWEQRICNYCESMI